MADSRRGRAPREAVIARGGGVMIVGPSGHFASGVSQYTARLAEALADPVVGGEQISLLLLRRLCPRFMYPGGDRVGRGLTSLRYPDGPRFDGVDYYWLPSIAGALRFLRQVRPDVVVLQWWTGTVAHTHLALAVAARRLGARVVVEFHETLDIGESTLPLVTRYGRLCITRLAAQASGVIVHSQHDAQRIRRTFGIDLPTAVVHHPPFDQYSSSGAAAVAARDGGVVRLLFFGVIRPHKGLDDLVDAFILLRDRGVRATLRVVGEVWQGYDAPVRRLAGSRYADDSAVDLRYVHDEEVAGIFDRADIVVLPYRQASASGPLAIAIARAMPVVVTDLPALHEVVERYPGGVTCRPGDPVSLADAIVCASDLVGSRHEPAFGWPESVGRLRLLFDALAPARMRAGASAAAPAAA